MKFFTIIFFLSFFFIIFFQCQKSNKEISTPIDMVMIHQENGKSFLVDKTEVTVKDFSNFVQKKGYVTDSEKFGNSVVFKDGQWQIVDKASWRYPLGKNDKNAYVAKGNHPVVHVSFNDAVAYAKFVNKRLPTEKEWEAISVYAKKKLKTKNKKYPWGDTISIDDRPIINIWQGYFPYKNENKDGYFYTSPAGSFPDSNIIGISDIGGNVWELCDSNQWFWFSPERQKWYQILMKKKTIKGGSFMCHESYCHGYLYQNKMTVHPNEAYFHIGFRLVRDID